MTGTQLGILFVMGVVFLFLPVIMKFSGFHRDTQARIIIAFCVTMVLYLLVTVLIYVKGG